MMAEQENVSGGRCSQPPGDWFEINAAAMGLSGQTLEAARGAEPRGRIVHAGDGTPLIRDGEILLGMPFGFEELEAQVADRLDGGVVVIFGLGTGQVARAVRAMTDAPVVAYEPDAGILRTVLDGGPSDLGGIHVVTTLHDLGQAWPALARYTPTATLIRSPGYVEHFPEEATALAQTVEQLVQRVSINENTHRLRARTWIEDILENISALAEHPSFLKLAGKYAGVPAFIVGSGPSLSKNGPLLAKAVRRGIVFSVNSSARSLASYGVEPQVVACIESIDVSKRLADLPFIDRAVRAFSLAASPAVLRTGKGPLLSIYEGIPEISKPLEPIVGEPGLPVCGSVTTAVFSLAQRLGCSPIVIVGQDLAYTDGLPYAEGTGYESSRATFRRDSGTIELSWNEEVHAAHGEAAGQMHEREALFEVERWGGDGLVATGASFNAVRSWLETAAVVLAAADGETRLVNATEGGARIAGFEERRLGELLDELPEAEITARSIAADAARADAPIDRSALAQWARDQALRARSVRRAAKRAHKLAVHGVAAIRAQDPGTVSRAFEELEGAEEALRKAVASAPIVESWTLEAVDDALRATAERPSTADARVEAEWGVRREADVAKAIEKSTHALERELERVAQRLMDRPLATQPRKETAPCL